MCEHSSVRLLEPFQHSHNIQLISGCTGIMSRNRAVGDVDRAPEIPANGMKSNLSLATTSHIEDPPGLYKKVEQKYYIMYHKCYLLYFDNQVDYLLSEWVHRFHQPGMFREGDKIYAAYISRVSILNFYSMLFLSFCGRRECSLV